MKLVFSQHFCLCQTGMEITWELICFKFQTVKLCWKCELYDAVIYVYNRGMADFGTPLEVLNNNNIMISKTAMGQHK